MKQQTITAFYDSREYASNAALMLRQAGIPETDITLSPENIAVDNKETRSPTGFWASLEEMFGGSDDHGTYSEGLRRGGTMVAVRADDTKVDEAIRVLEQHGSVDLDERETAWRGEGWTGNSAVAGSTRADTATGLGVASTATSGRTSAMQNDVDRASTAKPAVAGASAARAGQDDVLQVVEEQLDVGKRAVNRGKVRIHSYVVETPVTETVNLRDETVTLDRRPVDRPLGAAVLGNDAFKDRTIEMDEVDEEAVVAKSARVVEEIGIRKDVSDRTQTISDTVRSTKVDVDDARASGVKTGAVGAFSTEIAANMDVVGSDGMHVGVVDHVNGASIKLKKNDPASSGQHHLIPTDWVKFVDTKITLKTTAADTKSRWTAA